MKRLITGLRVIFVLVIVFLLEGLSYRFTENYSNLKLTFFWGKIDAGIGENPSWSLPFDGLSATAPSSEIKIENINQLLSEEFVYESSVTKFGRPIRDKYEDFIGQDVNPLKNYDRRNFQNASDVSDLIFPNFTRQATEEDIKNNYARRVGDTLNYSRALLIYLEPQESTTKEGTNGLEHTFGFLLGEKISCMKMKVSSYRELKENIIRLRDQEPLQSRNIILWGKGEQASRILEILNKESNLIALAIIQDPARVDLTESSFNQSWVYTLLSKPYLDQTNSSFLSDLLSITRNARDSDFQIKSKLGGLMHRLSVDHRGTLPNATIPALLKCIEFSEIQKSDSMDNLVVVEDADLASATQRDEILEESNVSEELFEEIKLNEPLILSGDLLSEQNASVPSFDCEILRAYKSAHKGDPILSGLSDQEIILQLGKQFEEMGYEIVESISEQDPIFWQLYRTLR